MKDLIIMLWGIIKVELSRQEKIASWIGTFTGGGVAIGTKPMTIMSQITFSGELYYIGRAIVLMLIGATISYFVPKVLKKWHNQFLDWRKKRKQGRQ
jgi:hypothetical protein